MADAIAELGLDAGSFNAEMDAAVSRMKALAQEALVTTGNLAAMAVLVGGALASGIYNVNQQMKALEGTLQEIKNNNPFNSQIVSVGELESQIKRLKGVISSLDEEGVLERIYRFAGSSHLLGGSGFDKSEEEREALRAKAAAQIEANIKEIGKQEQRNLDILQADLEGQQQKADMLKAELEYDGKIAKAIEQQLPDKAAILEKEKQVTIQKLEQLRIEKELAAANKAMQETGDDLVKRQEADQKAIDKDEAEDQKVLKADRERAEKEKLSREALNRKDTEDYERDKRKQNEDFDRQTKDRLKQIQDLAKANGRSLDDAKAQTQIGKFDQAGNRGFGNELSTREAFIRRRRDAYDRHASQDELDELRKQEEQAMRDAMAQQARRTPGEARDERREQRDLDRDQRRQQSREDELRRRGSRGADSRDIKEQREKDIARHENVHKDDKNKNQADNQSGWSQTDKSNLSKCATQLSRTD